MVTAVHETDRKLRSINPEWKLVQKSIRSRRLFELAKQLSKEEAKEAAGDKVRLCVERFLIPLVAHMRERLSWR
jgi:hypothetical protein